MHQHIKIDGFQQTVVVDAFDERDQRVFQQCFAVGELVFEADIDLLYQAGGDGS